jgi:DNA replication protein
MKNQVQIEKVISFRLALLDSYKKLGLNENEAMVILLIDYLLSQGNSLITSDLLSLKMTLQPEEIDGILVELLNKKYLSYKTEEGKLVTSIENIRKIVYSEMKKTLTWEVKKESVQKDESLISDLYSLYEDKASQPLSPLEKDTIVSWLKNGYSEEEIKNAVLDTARFKKLTIREVERTLKAKRRAKDLSEEGVSAIKDNYDKSIAETLENAKKLWGD